ncbi:MAG: M67 family metallopeptidase [Candidatus Omnitrophota bacterium]
MLKIPKNIRDEMLAQAKKDAPIEACGYLAGKGSRVEKRFALRNADNSSEHFSFEPKEQFQTVKEARAAGLELLAVYHSHPATPARPSEEDLKLAFDPDTVYVIISLLEQSPNITAFRVKGKQTVKVPIEITGNQIERRSA